MNTVVDVLAWTGVVVAGALALYGAGILITGRAPTRTRNAFRSVTEAGLYSLCNGAGLVLLLVSILLSPPISFAVLGAAVLLCGLAFLKFRPRSQAGA